MRVQVEPSSEADRAATSAIIFIFLGAVLLVAGSLLLGLLSFAAAGYTAMRWSANEARQRTQEKRENQISIRSERSPMLSALWFERPSIPSLSEETSLSYR
jgi:hypothetical protein